MKFKNTLLLALLAFAFTGLTAQEGNRYIDPVFSASTPTVDTFGNNIDVFLATLAANGVPVNPNREMEMDVYQPEGDTASLRPVVVLWHTGNFLPRFVNRGTFGTRRDSAIVEFATRLAELGYVGITADYRQGWDPASINQDVRTGTLLQAAYRGGQDGHMMARFLRKQVVEDGNPYRIDTSRIVFWGFGTGGYVAMTHAFLDRIEEVEADLRFFGQDREPYVNLAVNSNPQGTLLARFPNGVVSNIPNHVGYESTVAMSINTGGALGDPDWMEGKDDEPITIGYHYVGDPNAPFSFGNVIVPTTGDLVVPGVAGTEQIVEMANMFGLNESISSANDTDLSAIFSDLSREVNRINAGYKEIDVDGDPDGTTGFPDFDLSHDNMFPFGINDSLSGTYNYTSEPVLRGSIAVFNQQPLPDLDANAAIAAQLNGNPNLFNPAAANLVIDTIMAHFIPRAYIGLDLDGLVSTEELVSATSINLNVYPNPSAAGFTVEVADNEMIRDVQILDIEGRILRTISGVDASRVDVARGELNRGVYIVQLRLDAGISAQKVILN